MNDAELFGLTAAVYRKTGWGQYGDEGLDYFKSTAGKSYPLYTSDYLLEKLNGVSVRLQKVIDSELWFVEDTVHRDAYNQVAETPLKALLKLVIALHEAGDVS